MDQKKWAINQWSLGFIFLLFLIMVGCSAEKGQAFEMNGVTYHFPSFVFDAQHPLAAQAYAFVTDEQDILEYIPCYCQCGDAPFHHSSVKSCFIKEQSTVDSIIYDDHGAG